MPGKEKFEAQVAALEALRQLTDADCVAPLRAALKQRNNYLVAKAADMAGERRIEELIPDLSTAFERFFVDPEKSDPQCWAKNSLSRALAALELQEPAPFLRGLRHVQLEAVWGGRSDTAGTLRGNCALALVQCRSLPEAELLRSLLDVLLDADKSARGDAVRALGQVGSATASLLLRLRGMMGGEAAEAALGEEDVEVRGACYSAVLDIEGTAALPWVSRFLASEDSAAGEAALAIASTHTPEAFTVLRPSRERSHDPWFRSVVLSAIALTRQTEAVEFLLAQVKADSRESPAAVEALLRALPSDEVIERVKAAVAGNSRLERAFGENAPRG